jgi:hypothetical protein
MGYKFSHSWLFKIFQYSAWKNWTFNFLNLNLTGIQNPMRLWITLRWNIFSLIEKGVEYMALVTPNMTFGINGYTLFFKFLRDRCLNDLSSKMNFELFIHNVKVGWWPSMQFSYQIVIIWFKGWYILFFYDPSYETVIEMKYLFPWYCPFKGWYILCMKGWI